MNHSDQRSRWWTDLAWRLYFCLPGPLDDILKWRFPYILPFKTLRIPIAILRGHISPDGHPGTVIVAGSLHEVNHLIWGLFEDQPKWDPICEVPLWKLARTLRRLRISADLTIARLDQFSARLFFGADYLVVPEWIGSRLVVPEDPLKLAHESHSLEEDLRIVCKNRLTYEVTHAEKDFMVFYHTMYAPFIVKRHGQQAVVHDIYRIRRIFNRGGLLLVKQNGQPVAGVIFQEKNQILRLFFLGTLNGAWAPVKAGAIAGLYLFSIEHAKTLGCKIVDFGGSRPSLNDGLLRYKKKWGMNLIDKSDNYYEFLVYWNHFNNSVISFLSNTPLIFRNHHGLSAISVIKHDKPVTLIEAREIHRYMWIPGLHRLYIVSNSGWQSGISTPPQTHLLDATTIRNCDPSTLLTISNQPPMLE
ncbi:MAG: hypothetical protein ACREOW_13975 [Thermodesulfobacteriota bacterium]